MSEKLESLLDCAIKSMLVLRTLGYPESYWLLARLRKAILAANGEVEENYPRMDSEGNLRDQEGFRETVVKGLAGLATEAEIEALLTQKEKDLLKRLRLAV